MTDAARNGRLQELAEAMYSRRWKGSTLAPTFDQAGAKQQGEYLDMADAGLKLMDEWGAADSKGHADTSPEAAPQVAEKAVTKIEEVLSEEGAPDEKDIPF